jgi:thiamine-phosphate diphosphorylase
MIPRLHLVTDDRVLEAPGFPDRVREVARVAEEADRPVALHLRGPGLSGRRLWERGRELRSLVGEGRIRLLVNDRVDLALILGNRGVHLGARSLPPRAARRILGPEALLGRSVHGAEEAEELGRDSGGLATLDYLVVGTLYATPSHPHREGAGPKRVGEVAAVTDLPLLGIGGVTPERVHEVVGAGAHGVAVVRAVWDAPDAGAAVKAFLQALEAADPGESGLQTGPPGEPGAS